MKRRTSRNRTLEKRGGYRGGEIKKLPTVRGPAPTAKVKANSKSGKGSRKPS